MSSNVSRIINHSWTIVLTLKKLTYQGFKFLTITGIVKEFDKMKLKELGSVGMLGQSTKHI